MAIVFIILVLLTVFTYTPLAIYSEGWRIRILFALVGSILTGIFLLPLLVIIIGGGLWYLHFRF